MIKVNKNCEIRECIFMLIYLLDDLFADLCDRYKMMFGETYLDNIDIFREYDWMHKR
jgi:hypothetical protein